MLKHEGKAVRGLVFHREGKKTVCVYVCTLKSEQKRRVKITAAEPSLCFILFNKGYIYNICKDTLQCLVMYGKYDMYRNTVIASYPIHI